MCIYIYIYIYISPKVEDVYEGPVYKSGEVAPSAAACARPTLNVSDPSLGVESDVPVCTYACSCRYGIHICMHRFMCIMYMWRYLYAHVYIRQHLCGRVRASTSPRVHAHARLRQHIQHTIYYDIMCYAIL